MQSEQQLLLTLTRELYTQLYQQEFGVCLRQTPAEIFSDPNRVRDLLTIFGMVPFKAATTIIEFFFNQIKTTLGNGHLVGLEHHQLKKYETFGTLDHHRSGESNDQDELGWGLMCATLMAGMGAALDLFVNVASVPIVVEPEVFEMIKNTNIRSMLQSENGEENVREFIHRIIRRTALSVDQNTLGVFESYFLNLVLSREFLETDLSLSNLFATEESLDADQWLASLLVINAGNHSILNIVEYLREKMPPFLEEEFSIFGSDSHLLSTGEAVAKINEIRMAAGEKEFQFPEYRTHVFMPSEADQDSLVPIVVIEVQLDKLPITRGYWNHIATNIVAATLRAHGLSKYHESGVVTCVIHSSDVLTDEMRAKTYQEQKVYGPERLIKTDRIILGLSSVNNQHWSEQYVQNELAITTHETVARLFAKIFPPHPVRNLLIASQKSPDEKIVPKPPKGVSHKQLGWLEFVKQLEKIGYSVAMSAAV